MQPSFINILLSDDAARAVCWTLVHSIWEGVLAALFAGLIILCTRKLPSTLRYNMLAADLLLFVLVAGATFFYEFGQSSHAAPTGPMAPGSSLSPTVRGSGPASISTSVPSLVRGSVSASVPASVPATGGNELSRSALSAAGSPHGETSFFWFAQNNWVRRVNDYLNTHATLVTLIWLICISGQVLRLMTGLYQVRRLRQNGIARANEYWEERLMALAGQLGIKRKVQLLQSGSVEMPSVLGFIKPYILLPLGMLSNLPSDQVETILLHELAHIRRSDYLTNLLLHFTEAIFFFNPGVRWIGALIRREREACCDDMVLRGTPDRNNYFEALIAFTQWTIDGKTADGPSLALQLGKSRTDLLWRIKRMLDKENKKLQIMEKAILSFGLLALVSISLISMKAKDNRSIRNLTATEFTSVAKSPASVAKSPASDGTEPASGVTVPATAATSPTSGATTSASGITVPTTPNTRPGPATTTHGTNSPIVSSGSPLPVATDTVPSGHKEKGVTAAGRIRKGNYAYMQCKSGSEDGKKTFHMEAKDADGTLYQFDNTQGGESVFVVNGKLIPIEEYHNYADFLENVGQLQGFKSPGVPVPDPLPAVFVDAAPFPGVSPGPVTPILAVIPPSPPAIAAITEAVTAAAPLEHVTIVGRVGGQSISEHAEVVTPTQPAQPAKAADVYIDPSIGRIVDDLMDAGIISKKDPLSFKLDKSGLVVNGATQPEDIAKKFSAKYMHHRGDQYIYTRNGGNSHVSVKIDD